MATRALCYPECAVQLVLFHTVETFKLLTCVNIITHHCTLHRHVYYDDGCSTKHLVEKIITLGEWVKKFNNISMHCSLTQVLYLHSAFIDSIMTFVLV